MLLLLSTYLTNFIKAFRVFEYVTFRALLASLFALLFSLKFGDKVIIFLTKLKVKQSIRDVGPQSHLLKTGTPTMGGILIIITLLLTTLIFADLKNKYVWLLVGVLISAGLLGFIDDYKKIVYKNSEGLSGKLKLFWQFVIAIVALIYLVKYVNLPFCSQIIIPFAKEFKYPIGIYGFFILSSLVIVGSSNAVNLTDGLDGLVSFPIIIVAIGLAILSYISGNKIFSHYLLMPHIPGAHEITVFCGALVGSMLGFLWFNAYPAKVFMGDVGSLAIGAILGVIAIILRQEIAFAIMGGIFVFEAISVMLQVGYYKWKKKRIFLMAPLHHHFELKGWSETQVVVRFWIISIILLLIGLSTIKLR